MRETLEQLTARVNANAYLPTKEIRKMAKAVKLTKGKEFTFAPAGGGQLSKYPWDEWLSGGLLLLEQSEGTEDDKGTITNPTTKKDYEVSTDSMPAKIKTASRRKYKVTQISRRDADGNRLGNALIIRSRDMTLEERQAEDQLRAEERADRKAKNVADAQDEDQNAA